MRDNDRRELWERDKSVFQRAKINLNLWYMKFQRQTHGMGLIFMIMMCMLMLFLIFQAYENITSRVERERIIREQACKSMGGCYQST